LRTHNNNDEHTYLSRKLASFIALAGADRGAAFVASPSAIVHTERRPLKKLSIDRSRSFFVVFSLYV
jgi:hypothetical protein